MKNLTIFILLGVVVVVTLITYKSFNQSEAYILNQPPLDKKLAVVRNFWGNSLNGKGVESLITSPPPAFYDETSRCDHSLNEDSFTSSIKGENNPFSLNLKSTAQKIQKEKLELISIDLERHWNTEAIVDVQYSFPNTKIKKIERRFFFLTEKNGKWKIFLDTSVLNLLNKEFAKYDCS